MWQSSEITKRAYLFYTTNVKTVLFTGKTNLTFIEKENCTWQVCVCYQRKRTPLRDSQSVIYIQAPSLF